MALGGSVALSLIGGGNAAAKSAPRAATAARYATPLATLASKNGATFRDGVQHFQTEPDLKPPQVAIDKPYDGDLGGLIITDCVVGPAQSGPMIIDQNGRVVWFHPAAPKPTQEHRAFNVRVQQYRDKPVLCWWEGAIVAGHGQGSYVIYDTSYKKIAEVSAHNGYQGDLHEFVLTDSGTALFTAYGYDVATIEVAGKNEKVKYFYGVVQEVDVASGKLLFQWRSDHHVPLTESYLTIPPDGLVWDYFHVNSISIDPADRNLIIGGRNTWACYKVHRTSGEVLWRLGGKDSDFKMGKGTKFAFQHDINMHKGEILTVFDNSGGPPRESSESKALVLSVNEKKRSVQLIHRLSHTPPLYAPALGSVQPLSGGDTFVGWGRRPYFSRYDSKGKVVFDGHLSVNANLYRAYLQPWEATPASKPAIKVKRSGTTATVYVSWNGATKLSSWGVLGGATTALTELGAAAVHGFETAITVTDAPKQLAVRAYDSDGVTLATSKVASG